MCAFATGPWLLLICCSVLLVQSKCMQCLLVQKLRSFQRMDQAYQHLALRLLDASEFTYSDRK